VSPTADPQSEIRMRQNSRGLEKRDNTYAE
jgi:hypothetical protein